MSKFKRKNSANKKELRWGSPKYYYEKVDSENLDKPRKRKKICKLTKGQHEFLVKEMRIDYNYIHISSADVNIKNWKDVKLFNGITIWLYKRCGCGKKDLDISGSRMFGRNWVFKFPTYSYGHGTERSLTIKRNQNLYGNTRIL